MTSRRLARPLAASLLFAAAVTAAGCSSTPVAVPGAGGGAEVEAAEATTATAPVVDPVATTIPEPVVAPTSLECVAALPIETRVAQVLMPFIDGDGLEVAGEVVERFSPGGVLLMSWPDTAPDDGLGSLSARASIPLQIAVDEEGGTVQRLRRLSTIPSARAVAESMSPAEAEELIAEHAAIVAGLGVTMVFAPVVDVAPLSGPDTMGTRTYSADPAVVAEYAAAYARAWQRAGVLPVLKHFPGHGSASADTHDARATTPALDVLAGRDLEPYRALADHGGLGVMVGHLDVPGLTDTGDGADAVPASLSTAAITGVLRGDLGYGDALVVTDALNMAAITTGFSEAEAALAALIAGADVVLYANLADTAAIIDHIGLGLLSGVLSTQRLDDAVDRVLRTKAVDACALID